MSNIAGKAYAMNLLTPTKWYLVWWHRLKFKIVAFSLFKKLTFKGLETLSLIHYARWVIVTDKDFPRLSQDQPAEKLKYGYMFFFSNFNGSWTQYVDSFSIAIPGGLNLVWDWCLKWPGSVPETQLNKYVISNQIWTEHYYSAYPMASANDVKSAHKVREALLSLNKNLDNISPEDFLHRFNITLLELQADLSQMDSTPVVSLAQEALSKRERIEQSIE